MKNESSDTARKIEKSLLGLRHAIEDRAYDRAQLLLVEQNQLFADANIHEEGMRELAVEAQRMNQWALTMTRMNRAHLETEFSQLQQSKTAEVSYAMVRPMPSKLVNTEG